METRILRESIAFPEIEGLAQDQFGDFVKAVGVENPETRARIIEVAQGLVRR